MRRGGRTAVAVLQCRWVCISAGLETQTRLDKLHCGASRAIERRQWAWRAESAVGDSRSGGGGATAEGNGDKFWADVERGRQGKRGAAMHVANGDKHKEGRAA